jgi:hypothetical protein
VANDLFVVHVCSPLADQQYSHSFSKQCLASQKETILLEFVVQIMVLTKLVHWLLFQPFGFMLGVGVCFHWQRFPQNYCHSRATYANVDRQEHYGNLAFQAHATWIACLNKECCCSGLLPLPSRTTKVWTWCKSHRGRYIPINFTITMLNAYVGQQQSLRNLNFNGGF